MLKEYTALKLKKIVFFSSEMSYPNLENEDPDLLEIKTKDDQLREEQ